MLAISGKAVAIFFGSWFVLSAVVAVPIGKMLKRARIAQFGEDES